MISGEVNLGIISQIHIMSVTLEYAHCYVGSFSATIHSIDTIVCIFLLGDFLARLFATIDAEKFADIPLVFLTYSISQLPQEPLLGPETLASIRCSLI